MLLVATAMALLLAGCGSSQGEDQGSKQGSEQEGGSSQQTPEPTTNEQTSEPTTNKTVVGSSQQTPESTREVGSSQQPTEATTNETSVGRCADSRSTPVQQGEASRGEASNGKVAFARATEGAAANSDIYVVDEEGAHETRLTHTKQFEGNPVWSPDGQKLAYISDPSEKLYVMNADGSNQTRLPGPATAQAGLGLVPSWSPDGQKLAYTSVFTPGTVGGNDIYVINMNANGPDEARLTMLTGTPEDGAKAKLGSPVWSPNGERIAFISFTMADTDASASESPSSAPVAGLTGIYLINADGTGLCKLTSIHEEAQSVFYRPVWSPDGQRIAFVDEGLVMSPPQLNVIDPDGSGRKRIADTPESSSALPTWSPDSKKIAFSCSIEEQVNAHTDVCVINADGTGKKRIATNVAPLGSYVAASWGRG